MKTETGKIIPMMPRGNGRWISPEEFARKAKNGKGIKLKTVMDKIYSGKLKAQRDDFGWWIWEPERNYQTQPLKVA